MTVSLSFIGGAGWQFFDNNGKVLSGGKLYTYAAGSTTPLATYTSRSGTVPNTNPIILDSAGRTPAQIWATEGLLYKYVVMTSAGVLIRSWDNIGGSVVASDLGTDLANTTDNSKGDALVGFRQSNASGFLSNTVGRTVNAKLQELVSVKDFGAIGDGIVNDRTAIRNAIAALTGTGGTVFFPPGTYRVSGAATDTAEIDLDVSGVTLLGCGSSSTIYVPENRRAISIGGTSVATTVYDVGVQNLRLLATKNSTYRVGHITINYCSRVNVSNCFMENSTATGVNIAQYVTDCRIEGNKISNFYETGVDGTGWNIARAYIINNIITTNAANPSPPPPNISRPIGIAIEPQSAGSHTDFVIRGNIISFEDMTSTTDLSQTYGIAFNVRPPSEIPAITDYVVKRCLIQDNVIRGVGWGISINRLRVGAATVAGSVEVSGNMIERCRQDGIVVGGGLDNLEADTAVINSNVIKGYSEAASNTSDGIKLDNYLVSPVVDGNYVARRIDEPGAASGRYALNIASANVSNAVIGTNYLSGNTSATVNDASTVKASFDRVSNVNYLYQTTGTLTADVTYTPSMGSVLRYLPSGADRSIVPSTSAIYAFNEGAIVHIINTATAAAAFSLVFDPLGINARIQRQSSGVFIYNAGAWSVLPTGADTITTGATAANIASAAAAVNTSNKYFGKIVYDINNARAFVAQGALPTSSWILIDGSLAVTPV